MSLDVYLTTDEPVTARPRQAIFIRRNGSNEEITRDEWDKMFPDHEPTMAIVDTACAETTEVYSANITHNLGKMAGLAGLYSHLWRPDEVGVTRAEQLIDVLAAGLDRLRVDPDAFKAHNPANGWGDYDGLVRFTEEYLAACRAHPKARVSVWR